MAYCATSASKTDIGDAMYKYEVSSQYGYYSVNFYKNDKLRRTVITQLSKNSAELIAGELNQAIEYGYLEALERKENANTGNGS